MFQNFWRPRVTSHWIELGLSTLQHSLSVGVKDHVQYNIRTVTLMHVKHGRLNSRPYPCRYVRNSAEYSQVSRMRNSTILSLWRFEAQLFKLVWITCRSDIWDTTQSTFLTMQSSKRACNYIRLYRDLPRPSRGWANPYTISTEARIYKSTDIRGWHGPGMAHSYGWHSPIHHIGL